jgi:hypothetical protein
VPVPKDARTEPSTTPKTTHAMRAAMQTLGVSLLAASFVVAGCDHPTPPAASAPAEVAPAPAGPSPSALPDVSAAASPPEAPRGKRAACTTDQSCNGDSSMSALWGHCVTATGVCECNVGFELHPGGYCQPIKK